MPNLVEEWTEGSHGAVIESGSAWRRGFCRAREPHGDVQAPSGRALIRAVPPWARAMDTTMDMPSPLTRAELRSPSRVEMVARTLGGLPWVGREHSQRHSVVAVYV